MNSIAAASRLASPSTTSLATWVSCAVSARDVSVRLARAWPPSGFELGPGPVGETLDAHVGERVERGTELPRSARRRRPRSGPRGCRPWPGRPTRSAGPSTPRHAGRTRHRSGFVLLAVFGVIVIRTERPLTPSWPPSLTGSPPTGSPSSPGRRPTCSSAFAMDARSPGAPRRARAANRQRAAKRSDRGPSGSYGSTSIAPARDGTSGPGRR